MALRSHVMQLPLLRPIAQLIGRRPDQTSIPTGSDVVGKVWSFPVLQRHEASGFERDNRRVPTEAAHDVTLGGQLWL